jgi:hypothetical protein
MNIEEENKAKEYYISSDINGIHTPRTNMVELNQLDLYKLMHGFAQEEVKKLKLCGVSRSAKVEDKQTPLNWLLTDKFKIVKGSTYTLPDITVRQCASWIGEYVKKHYC